MPKINQVYTLEVSPEKFLDNCSPAELQEVDMLLGSPRYRNKMKTTPDSPIDKAIASIAGSHPSLTRGKVWCKKCGREENVSSADAFVNGWPVCCGETMTIDHPDRWKKQ